MALLRGRAPQLSHRFPSWPSISRASSMSTNQPCSTQTGYQREARKELPYFPDFRFFLQTTYFCIGEMWDGCWHVYEEGGGNSEMGLECLHNCRSV